MVINIYTDASVHLQSGEAGFAHWTACMQFEAQKASWLVHVSTSVFAELYSINDAAKCLLEREIIPVTQVNIYTDSTEAIHKLKNNRPRAFFTMIDFTIKNGMRPYRVQELFKFHHIKAHTKNEDVGSYRNGWCDSAAKQHRIYKQEFTATIFDHSDILL